MDFQFNFVVLNELDLLYQCRIQRFPNGRRAVTVFSGFSLIASEQTGKNFFSVYKYEVPSPYQCPTR